MLNIIKKKLTYVIITVLIINLLLWTILIPFAGKIFISAAIFCLSWVMLFCLSRNYKQFILYNLPLLLLLIGKTYYAEEAFKTMNSAIMIQWIVVFVMSLFCKYNDKDIWKTKDIVFFYSVIMILFFIIINIY